MNLYEILNWFEKNQINFNETEKKSFFKELREARKKKKQLEKEQTEEI